jgi:hypothetical protein
MELPNRKTGVHHVFVARIQIRYCRVQFNRKYTPMKSKFDMMISQRRPIKSKAGSPP